MKRFFLIPLLLISALASAAPKPQTATADSTARLWKLTGNLGLNANATGLMNWKAGGNNSVNGLLYTNMRLLFDKDHLSWETELNLMYGIGWNDETDDRWRKTNDKINLATKFGWEFQPKWYLTILGSMNTQFAYGRKYNGTVLQDQVTSKFMAPGYFDMSLGFDWKPNAIFSAYISPLAGRFTVVRCGKNADIRYFEQTVDNAVSHPEEWLAKHSDCGFEGDIGDQTAFREFVDDYYFDLLSYNTLSAQLHESYGLWHYEADEYGILVREYNRTCRAEFGMSVKCAVNWQYKGLTLASTLGLFTPYRWDNRKVYSDEYGLYLEPTEQDIEATGMQFAGWMDNNRRFGHFDVDWTVNIGYQFLKCLQVTIAADLRYYPSVLFENGDKVTTSSERVQLKGVLGLGVGYAF